MKKPALLGALLLVWASGTFAQSNIETNTNGDFSGRVYSDYYWIAKSHNNDIEGEHGIWIRRVYFTYDRQISNAISARFRLEGSSPGDFVTSAKITPVVKDLYLRWENNQHQVDVGITSTPTFALVEDVWGYRSVEKSPLDLLDFASSRDLGISATGTLDDQQRLNYHVMFGNGQSNKSEINRGKKFMLSLGYELTDNLVVEAYADFNDLTGNKSWYTLQGFAAYRSDLANVGVLYAHQVRNNHFPGTDLNLDLLSLFSNFAISENTKGFLRVDHTFDPIPGVNSNDYFPISNLADATIVIAGVDFDLGHNINLIPNIEAATYQEQQSGIKPGNDVIPRLTLYYRF